MPGTKPAARRVFMVLRRSGALGLIGLGAAACGLQSQHQTGSSQPGTGVTQSPGSRSSTSAGGPCTTEELKVSLDLSSAGVAAGTSLIPLDFTNVGTANCELTGFADVSFVTSSSGHQVGPAATVDRSLSPQSLRLGAGRSAHLWLRLVEAADLPMSTCKPKNVAGLLVRLPGQATSIFIAHQFTTCAKRVHGTDILTVEPFKAGLARAGTAQ
ncbi:MAG TPA: DUF4232 domain-containing protein [Streptosporangiaceae bacterium]|jgi:hypothetical protein|nr:DUF4232 domain-containing protein [Streptosporangiaceae bacterium]